MFKDSRALPLLAALALSWALAGSARAAAPATRSAAEALSETAHELYAAAEQARAAGAASACYAKARAAWSAQRHYKIAAVLGDCALDLGRAREAAENLAFYAEHHPPGAPAETVRYLGERLARAKVRIAVLTLALSPPGAQASLDGEPVSAGTIYLEPGTHTVSAQHPGRRPAQRKLVLVAGSERKLELVLEAEGGGQDGGRAPLAGPVLFGAGAGVLALGLAGGIAFTVVANDKASAAEQAPRPSPEHRDWQEQQQSFSNAALWSLIGAGGGAAAAGVGLYLWSAGGEQPRRSAMHITPWAAASSAGAWITGRW